MKKSLKPDTSMAPVPVVMVSCGDEKNSNITTIAWTGIINSVPPMVYVSFRPTRHSYEMIKESGEFVINIPDEKLVWETDYCGTKSGKEVDKFETCKLTKEKAEVVKTPMIGECPINLECKVKDIQELGSHHMFIAEVVAVHCKEEFVQENGAIDYEKANIITYMGNKYAVADKIVGDRGICLK